MFSYDLARMMESVAAAVQDYSDAWSQTNPTPAGDAPTLPADRNAIPLDSRTSPATSGAPGDAAESDGMGVNEVLWSFMSEGDRLAEMGRLLGRLRFAQEGNDGPGIADITAEMNALGRQFPAEFSIAALIASASDPSSQGARMAQLYLQRCYSLSSGDAEAVRRIDAEIDGS